MPDFKCKLCGGTMKVSQDAASGVCIICGAKQMLTPDCLDADSDAAQAQAVQSVTFDGETADAEQLLKRGYMALEDGEWQQADKFFEGVLNQNAENAQAYLGKLLAEQNVGTPEDLKNREFPFDDSLHYQKILRFGEPALVKELEEYIDCINARNEKAEKESIYRYAVNAMKEGAFRAAAAVFESIPDVKDAAALAEKCRAEARKAVKRRRWAMGIAAFVVCAVAVSLIGFFAVVRPTQKLEKAVELLDKGYYKRSYAMLEELGKGASIPSAKYDTGIKLLKRGDYEAAYILLRDLSYQDSAEKAAESYGKYKEQKLKESHVGDTVYFGTYEQDGDTANGREDIKWLVLAREDGKALVISKYALDRQEYNTSYEAVTWETCSLRTWLNETFIRNAFSFNEQKKILTTDISADGNTKYETDAGKETSDKVFLLSMAEVETYFAGDASRKCAPTAYAKAQGAYVSDIYKTENGEDTCWWWLRTPGDSQDFAANICDDGSIGYLGVDVYSDNGAVRPALWIALDE